MAWPGSHHSKGQRRDLNPSRLASELSLESWFSSYSVINVLWAEGCHNLTHLSKGHFRCFWKKEVENDVLEKRAPAGGWNAGDVSPLGGERSPAMEGNL